MRCPPGQRTAAFAAVFLLLAARSWSITLPPQFVADEVAAGCDFHAITAFTFAPDGRMFVAQKNGYAWTVLNDARIPLWLWDPHLEVDADGNCGLNGIAVDPDFVHNHYIYFSYVMDPDSDGVYGPGAAWGRVVRFQTAAWDSNVVDPATRVVLIGRSWADGIPFGFSDHVMDGLRFGADGSLLVSAGDGATANYADAGGNNPDLFLPGRANPDEDIGAFRSQYIHSLSGKILRIDPATGQGYPSNPFFDGDPNSFASKVWLYGLRNPWRFCVRPGTGSSDPRDGAPGTLYIGDLGWTTWEELDIAPHGGMNFGWPCREGPVELTDYELAKPSHLGCWEIGTPDDPALPTGPVLTYHHHDPQQSLPPGPAGNAVMGGLFYEGSLYPPEYHDRYFFADYGAGWIRSARFDTAGALQDLSVFATDADGPVEFGTAPGTGDLYYLSVNESKIFHIRYTVSLNGDHDPVAHAAGTPLTGAVPITVALSSAGTIDPDGDPMTLSWNFGDGLGTGDPSPSHYYDRPGVYLAVLTAADGRGGIGRDTVRIVALENPDFPTTPILDDFERPDGPVGSRWTGEPEGVLVDAHTLELEWYTATTVWSDTTFGPEQEAYVSLVGNGDPATSVGLLLDGQGPSLEDGALLVYYEGAFSHVRLTTYDSQRGWESWGDPLPVRFADSDRIGARVYGNGVVDVLRNGSLVGSRSVAGWPAVKLGGRVGLLLAGNPGARVDDFGGGNTVVDGNHPPAARIVAPLDGQFFAAGDTIRLSGVATDDRDPPSSLAYHWDVSLAHNNHVHPDVFAASGPEAYFIGENHDDGTGAHYIVRLSVTDLGGLTDVERSDVYPEVNLVAATPRVTGPWVGTGSPTPLSLAIQNLGRMPAPLSHWTLSDGPNTLAGGDIVVPALDSTVVALTLPPGLAAGAHLFRLTADTLGAVRETREDDNAALLPVSVLEGAVGVAGAVPAVLSLGIARPNPARGPVAFALGLPAADRVAVTILDAQGRRVWGMPVSIRPAGRFDLIWAGSDDGGHPAAPGFYVARVEVGRRVLTRRFALLR